MTDDKSQEAFNRWKEDYGLKYEPYFSEADCIAAFEAGYQAALRYRDEQEKQA